MLRATLALLLPCALAAPLLAQDSRPASQPASQPNQPPAHRLVVIGWLFCGWLLCGWLAKGHRPCFVYYIGMRWHGIGMS